MISIIDYGMGNVSSIQNMIKKVRGESIITNDRTIINESDAIILPGVGSFDNGMTKLKSSGLIETIEEKVLINRTPFLGICLGMQLLFDNSDEGIVSGLGWVPGEIKRFNFHKEIGEKHRIPHMGWNTVNPTSANCLFKNLMDEARFYFVHSYYALPENTEHVLSYTCYGHTFVSSINKENIWGVQFHPEKSHRFGVTLIRNFLQIINC